MSSNHKRRQTMAKHTRERLVKERRERKQQKKDEKKQAGRLTPTDDDGETSTG
jgi:hypothetical protein